MSTQKTHNKDSAPQSAPSQGPELSTSAPANPQVDGAVEPVDWVESFIAWLETLPWPFDAIAKILKWARKKPWWIVIPVVVITILAVLLKKHIEGYFNDLGDQIAVWGLGSEPKDASLPPSYYSHPAPLASLTSIDWKKGAEWQPKELEYTDVAGSEPGYLELEPDLAYKDFDETFTVHIADPSKQRSIAWIPRLQHGRSGDRYYVITVTLPAPVPTCDLAPQQGNPPATPQSEATVTLSLVGSNHEQKTKDTTKVVPFFRFLENKPQRLVIHTKATKAQYDVDFVTDDTDSSGEPTVGSCADSIRPLTRLVDPDKHPLLWGTLGFVGPPTGNKSERISSFELVPAQSATPTESPKEK